MGFFNRRKFKLGKSYDIGELLDILGDFSSEEFKGFTLIEDEKEEGKYKIITVEESKKLEGKTRRNEQPKREFYNRIQGEANYINITPINTVPNYNDYQNTKGYQKQYTKSWSR